MKKLLLLLVLGLTFASCEKEPLEEEIILNLEEEEKEEEGLIEEESVNDMLVFKSPKQIYIEGVSYKDIIGSNYKGGEIFYFDTITHKALVFEVVENNKYYHEHQQHTSVYKSNNWTIANYEQILKIDNITNLKNVPSLNKKYWTSSKSTYGNKYIVYNSYDKTKSNSFSGIEKNMAVLIGEFN